MSTLFERIGEGGYAALITAVGGTPPAPKPAPAPVKVRRVTGSMKAAAAMARVANAPITGTSAYAADRPGHK